MAGNLPKELVHIVRDVYESAGFSYYESSEEDYYIFYVGRNILRRVEKGVLQRELRKFHSHTTLKSKVIADKRFVLLVVSNKHHPQVLSLIKNCAEGLFKVQSSFRSLSSTVRSIDFRLFLIDIGSLILTIRESYAVTATMFLNVCLQLYNLYHRFNALARPQSSFLTFNDLILVFSSLGLPNRLRDMIVNFNLLTGKRLTDTSVILEVCNRLFEIVIGVLEFFEETTRSGFFSNMVVVVKRLFSSIDSYSLVRRVTENYTAYVRDPQIILDPAYRQKVLDTHFSCVSNNSFMDFVVNSSNKHFLTTWKAYEENVVKFARNFGSSRVVEPICIVFEGAAGAGKSQLMNTFASALAALNYSIYTHSVPPVESGKDFYDDYENQDVFIMDDVGQQAVSQWRTIINFVSPVRYPLECASAHKKNTKFFNSKIILCTTNSFSNLPAFTKTDCISDAEALYRRVHLVRTSRYLNSTHLEYLKYDYVSEHRWVNNFIYPWNRETKWSLDAQHKGDLKSCAKYLVNLYRHLEQCAKLDSQQFVISEEDMKWIIDDEPETFYEAQSGGLLDWFSFENWSHLVRGRQIAIEWINYLKQTFVSLVSDMSETVTNWLAEASNSMPHIVSNRVLSAVFGGIISYILLSWLFTNKDVLPLDIIQMWKQDVERVSLTQSSCEERLWKPQSGVLHDYKRYSKFVIIHDYASGESGMSHAVVSGKNILFPAHTELDGKHIDIYASWEHYKAKHVELEKVKVKLVKAFYQCDMAVYQMLDINPTYKKCKYLFNDVVVKSPRMFLVNVGMEIPIIVGVNTFRNKKEISYSSIVLKKEITHEPGSGFETPIGSIGLCGTMLISEEQGIVGMHVAGEGTTGFCVIPPELLAKEIRELMHQGRECKYDLDNKILENFSGVRYRYAPGEFHPKYPLSKTSYAPTMLHRDYSDSMQGLISTIENSDIAVGSTVINNKGPPIFKGESNPVGNLTQISRKTFARMGYIKDDELDYVRRAMSIIIPEYADLSDYETTFGSEIVARINPKSANGYGLDKDKCAYIDYENKELTPEFQKILAEFKNKCENDGLEVEDYLSTETFKDELRAPEKRNNPRTFRVMPLTHIWWTKKIFGRLLHYYATNLHKYGIAVGLNPFKDFHEVYERMAQCEVTSDIDFKSWDGTLSSQLMFVIRDVLVSKYRGDNLKVLQQLYITISRSVVLVFDALMQTTHGMPSGTWLTLLLNCFVNKSITALTLYRNGSRDPEDILRVVDYVMGDDKLCGASGKFSRMFNAKTVQEVAEQLGMTCTNGDKSIIESPSHPLRELIFLKRYFKFHPKLGRYVGCLAIDTIVNTLQWYDATKDYNEVMEGKLRSMQIEAFLHSDALFNKFTKLAKESHPYFALFDESNVLRILNSDEGYEYAMRLADKYCIYQRGG